MTENQINSVDSGPEKRMSFWEAVRAAENARLDNARRIQFGIINDPLAKLGVFGLRNVQYKETDKGTIPVLPDGEIQSIAKQLEEWNDKFNTFIEQLKAAPTMGDKLRLALTPGYYNSVGMVELAVSKNPDQQDNADDMRQQYEDLLEWYQKSGNPLEQMGPSPTNSLIQYSRSAMSDNLAVVNHSRRIARGDVPTPDDAEAHIQIIEKNTYGVPIGIMEAFEARFGKGCFEDDDNPNMAEAIDSYEKFISSPAGEKYTLVRIRQEYLLQTFDR